MKTLTVRLIDPKTGSVAAWVKMSSSRQLEKVEPVIGGPRAAGLELPTDPGDLVTLGCLAAAAADQAGLKPENEWMGKWELEPSTINDREEDAQ